MKHLNRFVLAAFGAAFFMASAQAQNAGTVSNHAVPVGKGPGVTGFTNVAPGATGIPLTSNGATLDPSFHPVTNAGIAPGAANTLKGSLDGAATSDIALVSCSALYQFTKWVSGTGWQCGFTPVLPSRAIAQTLNLSAFSAITTQGYAQPGDGGGATFYKRNSAILTYHIGNTGSCNNGTWVGIRLTGGTGTGAYGTLTVAGGVATNFTIQGAGAQGNRYTAADALTVSNAGNVVCATYPTVIVDTVGNGTFLDSSVTGITVNNVGAGCTNGSYKGLTPQNTVQNGGGFGDRYQINVDIVGGVVSSTSAGAPGGGYKVGDILGFLNPNTSAQIPGCATQPRIQISTVSTPRGSFTDSGGAAWQIVANDRINVLAFGAVADYNLLMPDGDATDNGAAFRAASEFAAIGVGPADAHGFGGGVVYAPRGSYLVCNGIIQYEYVTLQGAGWGASMLKQCNTDAAAASLITQGSPTTFVGNFATNTWDISLYGSTSGTGALIFSNNNQSGEAIRNVALYPNSTNGRCVKYTIGYGGQSMYGIHNALCVPTVGTGFEFDGNYGVNITGQTMISSVGAETSGFRFGDGGTAFLGTGVHCEGAVTNCVVVAGGGSSPPQVTVEGLLGPAITNLIYIETGTPANYTTVINAKSNGSPCTVFMQATATCVKTGNQLGLATY